LTGNEDKASWKEIQTPVLDKLSSVHDDHQTPKKLKAGVLLEVWVGAAPVGIGKEGLLVAIEDHMIKPSRIEQESTTEELLQIVLAK
jgi:hypothetical protein